MSRRLPEGIRERTLPDGSTRYDVRVELPRDPSTHARRTPSRTFRTLDEAKVGLRKWLTELDAGVVIAPDRITVADLCRRWLEEEASHRVRPTTLEDYAATLRVHVVPRIGRMRGQALAPSDVAALRAALLRETGIRSTQLALLRLKQVLAWGTSIELLPRNVAAGIKQPTHQAAEKRALSHAEARAFLEIAETDGLWPLWRVLLATGLRRGESIGLRWKDLDIESCVLSVRQQVVLTGIPKRPAIQEPKSSAARRSLDLDPQTVGDLVVHKERQMRLAHHMQTRHSQGLVFCTRYGSLLNPHNINRSFARLREDAGLDPAITLHSLRHSHATYLLLAGVPLLEVSRRLGHAKTSTTLDIYNHLLEGHRGSSVDAVAAALDGGVPRLDG